MKKKSENTTIVLKRLIFNLFSPSSKELSLNYLEISMDRGCWVWNVLVMLMLAEAHCFGTVKRCAWFPFTYGQTLKKNDNRITIEEKGIRKLCKKILPLQKKSKAFVMATACRNGYNKVMLGL